MFARMICSKPSVPHHNIQAKFGASPLELDAAFQVITYLHRIREFGFSSDGHHRLPWLALSSLGDQRCWYSRLSSWFSHLGLDIDHFPLSSIASMPHLHMSLPLTRRSTWSSERTYYSFIPSRHGSPSPELIVRLKYYCRHCLQIFPEWFIIPPGYTELYLPHALWISLG